MINEATHTFIEDSLQLLPTDKVLSQIEAQKRASRFLSIVAVLAATKHELTNQKSKTQSLFSVANHEALQGAEGSTVVARSAHAEASAPYIEAREAVEEAENDIKYISTMESVFTNAHILLRSMSKEIIN